MKIFGKKENVPVVEYKEVEGAYVWVVTWNSLTDSGFNEPTLVNCQRRAKAFLSENDANKFVDSLKEAMNLLQCSYTININVEKQE